MRVLHIGKYFPPFAGGMENFLADLSRESVEQGWDCAVVVHDHSLGKLAGEEEVDGCRLYRVPSYGRLMFAPVSPGYLPAVKRVIESFKPDIIHLHVPNTSAFWLLLLSSARAIPWVLHWNADVVFPQNNKLLGCAYWIYRPFEQALLKQARAIIATSPNYLQSSEVLKPHMKKCEVIPLALSDSRLEVVSDAIEKKAARMWETSRDTTEQPLKILSVGRLTHYKGHDLLIDAISRIDPAQHDVSVVIVGEGELRSQLAEMIDKIDTPTRIKLLGHQSDVVLQALLSHCDLLCLPSTLRTEAFGLVLLEAMYYGKPALVSQIEGSGMTWVIADQENGWYNTAGDAQDLSDKLVELSQNPEAIISSGLAARQKFMRHFSMPSCASQVIQLYQTVLATPE